MASAFEYPTRKVNVRTEESGSGRVLRIVNVEGNLRLRRAAVAPVVRRKNFHFSVESTKYRVAISEHNEITNS